MDSMKISLLFIYLATYQEDIWRDNGFNEESLLFYIYLLIRKKTGGIMDLN